MKDFSGHRSIIILAGIEILIIAVCLMGTEYYGKIIFLPFAAIAVALITFFGLLHIGMHAKLSSLITNHNMRMAITASIIVSYLTIIGFAAFFVSSSTKQMLPPISEMLLTNFNSVVAIVIAFYFGGTAYLDKKKGDKTTDLSNNTQPLSK